MGCNLASRLAHQKASVVLWIENSQLLNAVVFRMEPVPTELFSPIEHCLDTCTGLEEW